MKFVSVSDFLSQIKLKKDAIPAKAKLNERLRVLEDTHNIDPEGYRVSLWYMLIKKNSVFCCEQNWLHTLIG